MGARTLRFACLYAAPHRQDGAAIEENVGNRPPAAGARRYDRGELNDPVALAMAATGLELIAGWGLPSVAVRLRALTDRLADGTERPGARGRAAFTCGRPTSSDCGCLEGCPTASRSALRPGGVFVSERSGALRVSPHVWVDEDDLDALHRGAPVRHRGTQMKRSGHAAALS